MNTKKVTFWVLLISIIFIVAGLIAGDLKWGASAAAAMVLFYGLVLTVQHFKGR